MNRTTKAEEDAGERLARHVATGVASLIGVAIVAVGGAIYSHSAAIAQLGERCAATQGAIIDLHNKLSQYPPPVDLNRCSQRIETLEQYRVLDEHRSKELERQIEKLHP